MDLQKTKRVQETVAKAFVYGTVAFWLGKVPENEHSHRWTVYLRGLENEDLSYYIKKVTFRLHESFKDSLREVEVPPYEVTETGWGEFDIGITVHFHDLREAPITVKKHLKLFPDNRAAPKVGKPVVSEIYDEFVFHQPPEPFYQMLQAPPPRHFTDHQYNEYFTTQEFSQTEQKQITKLLEAQRKVQKRTTDVRAQLARVEHEIKHLS